MVFAFRDISGLYLYAYRIYNSGDSQIAQEHPAEENLVLQERNREKEDEPLTNRRSTQNI